MAVFRQSLLQLKQTEVSFDMYTNYKYTVKEFVIWTRHETLVFFALAIVTTALYEMAGWHWMQIPWTPLTLVGTAVAFLIGFQNNAAYGRAWEARKIWGGIEIDMREMNEEPKAQIPEPLPTVHNVQM